MGQTELVAVVMLLHLPGIVLVFLLMRGLVLHQPPEPDAAPATVPGSEPPPWRWRRRSRRPAAHPRPAGAAARRART